MVRRVRLDAELVRRGLARSRDDARELVDAGLVVVAGTVAHKPATQVTAAAPIVVAAGDEPRYVSRGGRKLEGALLAFEPRGLRVAGRPCLDAGASTGGFTEVLLRAGASRVVSVDVGYGQLAWPLRQDPRVVTMERTNVRELDPATLPAPPAQVVVADLSFISLRVVLPALTACADPVADFVLMVKPQFEVGRDRLGAGGVVRDPVLRAEAVTVVADAARQRGLGVAGVVASQLPGPSGNVEYFLWLRRGAPDLDPRDLQQAVEEGPQ